MFNQFGDLERCALRPGNVHSADGWEDVLKPIIARYQGAVDHIAFRGDAAFAQPNMYEFLESGEVGSIITNLSCSSKNIVGCYNKRGTAEQWIKEGKGAIKLTRLSCRSFNANAVRLQLHALAYDLGNFVRTLATTDAIADWSFTSLREKLIKIGAKVVSHGRYATFQMAEVAIPRQLFASIMQ